MRHLAIHVQSLSKRYHIGKRRSSLTLHATLEDALRTPVRHVAALLQRSAVRRNGRYPQCDKYLWALQEVSFAVQPGEVVGIIGRNGSGKSVLLKILARITKPSTGSAELHGRVAALLEVGTGFDPELTGRENISLSGAILGMKKAEIDRQFDKIVAFSEVERLLDTPVKHYSSGMYVRLAFAIAVHLEREILLMDEVLAVGDEAFQDKCLQTLHQIVSEGRTVLFVSHDMQAIQRLCPRTIWLSEGRIVLDGATRDVVPCYLAQTHAHDQPTDTSGPRRQVSS